jgi:peptidoglycan/LPS O-acetylase OafA/YrhL
VFSYSLYLTHELVIMQSWWFVIEGFPPILNTLLIVIPATIAFAWLFFRFCEKPYMRKGVVKLSSANDRQVDGRLVEEQRAGETRAVFAHTLPTVADEA